MKQLLFTLAAATLAVPAAAGDWTGFYGGAQIGYATGSVDPGSLGIDGTDYGIHAGYNRDMGEWVLGGELTYSGASYDYDFPIPVEGTALVTVKLRAGYDLGPGLLYGVAGWSKTWVDSPLLPNSISDDGALFGLGYEHRISDQISIGAEYNHNTFTNFNDSPSDVTLDTIQARVSFHF